MTLGHLPRRASGSYLVVVSLLWALAWGLLVLFGDTSEFGYGGWLLFAVLMCIGLVGVIAGFKLARGWRGGRD